MPSSSSQTLNKLTRLLQLIFPSWRLYDQLGHMPSLAFRVMPGGDRAFQEWTPLKFQPQRPWYGLFFNPQAGQTHAFNSVLMRLVNEAADVGDPQDLHHSVNYKVVHHHILTHIKQRQTLSGPTRYQFKVLLKDLRDGTDSEESEYLISPVYEA